MSAKPRAISVSTVLCLVTMFAQSPTDCSGQGSPRAVGDSILRELKIHRVCGPATGGAVLDVGQEGEFDAKWTSCPTVHHDGNVYRMWYSAFYDANMEPGGIGLAMSSDGIRWKRINDGRPLLKPGKNDSPDNGQILAPEVLRDGRRFLMWYTGMPIERHESGIGYYRIFLATSTDGLNWERANAGKPVLGIGAPDSPDAVQVATPSVIRDANGYRMWYAAWSPSHKHTICVARSNDGFVWHRQNDGQPVSGLDPAYAYGPAVTRYGNEYILLYMGTGHSLYGAASSDGIRWRMLNDGHPVLQKAAPGAFDDTVVGHPFLALEANRMRIWYTGYREEPGGAGPWKLRIGLAEAELPARAELGP